MQIYMNEQKLDASLTGEKNLKDIYKFFNEWVSEHKRYILGMRVDQQEVPLSGLTQIGADAVERIDFYVGDELDMLLTSVGELDSYVDQVGSTLFEKQEITKKDQLDLKEGLKWVRQLLQFFSSIIGSELGAMSVLVSGSSNPESVSRILERLERRVEYFGKEHSRRDIEGFLEDLRTFKFFIMRLGMQLRSLSSDSAELLTALEQFEKNIPRYKEKLISINESFQKGKDAFALETLEQITAKLNLGITALYAVDYRTHHKGKSKIIDLAVDSISFHTATGELTALLQDLSNALEEGDIVAVGDILEYELTEKLESLRPYLTKIIDKFAKDGQPRPQASKGIRAVGTPA